MIRNHYHYVTPRGRQQETEEALKAWLARMCEAPGFLGGSLLREFHHYEHDHLAIAIDWESHDAFASFWKANKEHAPKVAHHEQGHGHDHEHSHSGGEAHHHHDDESLPEETFHGHYEVVDQFTPARNSKG